MMGWIEWYYYGYIEKMEVTGIFLGKTKGWVVVVL